MKYLPRDSSNYTPHYENMFAIFEWRDSEYEVKLRFSFLFLLFSLPVEKSTFLPDVITLSVKGVLIKVVRMMSNFKGIIISQYVCLTFRKLKTW